jgi:polyferredoxin
MSLLAAYAPAGEAVDMSNMPCHSEGGEPMQMAATETGEQIMVMAGMPTWLFLLGIALILVLSFVIVERVRPDTGGGFRFNLLKNRKVYKIVRNRWFQAVPQMLMVGIFILLVYAGLAGSRINNIVPVAVWTIWWAGLVFAVALLGPLFCFMCPWDGLANLVSRLRIAARVPPITLGLKVPKSMRNMYPAIALFVFLTWAELGLGVTTDPRATIYMAIAITVLAVACALVFTEKAFCAYLCPVGRISGMYANFAPVEIRARKSAACKTCKTEDCLNGNERGYPCPTGISLKVVNNNTNCTMCTECVKSCNRQNVAVNLRPFAADLGRMTRFKTDEAWMCLTLLSLTLFHGFSMTTAWENHLPNTQSLLKWMALTFGTSNTFNFSIGMALACVLPIALYWLSCKAAAHLVRGSGVDTRKIFLAYSYSLLPIALFYHMAHNAMHLLMEGGAIVPMLSDPLGRGADYFGTAGVQLGHLLSDQALWYFQLGLILVGHLVGIVVAHQISRRLFTDKKHATRSLIPMLAIMILISVAGLALMVLDMNMRIGRM